MNYPPSNSPIRRYVRIALVAWTVVLVAMLVWQMTQIRQGTLDHAHIQARTAFDKDIIYRRWASMHGIVYVPVTDVTPPNPYLAGIPERDITTPSGKKLTLMNPAYMTRQAHKIEEQGNGVLGHITSLKPIRPENAADAWETEALTSFEKGNTESTILFHIDGKEYYRLMRPLIAEQSCLPCHATQGYKVGDIRGGISISVPMEPLLVIEREQDTTIALILALIWLVGMIGIVWSGHRLNISETERVVAQDQLLYQKNHDVLTGLYNRTFFEEEMHRLEVGKKFPISIIVADVNGLKVVNDAQGHAAGDQLLQHTANVLKASFRSEDVIARWGGDEFAILLPSTDSARNEECIARMKQTLANYRKEHQLPDLDFSLGGATAMHSAQVLPEVFRLADERMYQEKRAQKESISQ